MIDCDKLKKAYELAEKHYEKTSDTVVIENNQSYGCNSIPFILHVNSCPYEFHSLDGLIAKLIQLTQPRSKYKVGDECYWLIEGGASFDFAKIDKIEKHGDIIKYRMAFRYCAIPENSLYPTKSALIESQIEYWTKLKIHEMPSSKTCPKCGMQRMKDDVCWSAQCSAQKIVPFEREIKSLCESIVASHVGCDDDRAEECQHESDGCYYASPDKLHGIRIKFENIKYFPFGMPAEYKCLKCGEFYR